MQREVLHYRHKAIIYIGLWLISVLASLLFVTGAPLGAVTKNGLIDVSALVLGPPPPTPPTITTPPHGSTVDHKNITVGGQCIQDLVVKIFREDEFIGSSICNTDQTYAVQVDLVKGGNHLIAVQYDVLNQPSPESSVLTITYSPPSKPPASTPGSPANPDPQDEAVFQLQLKYDYTLQVIYAKQPFQLPIEFSGGAAPYALSIDWGDGKNDVISHSTTRSFTGQHIYDHGGYYTIKIRVSDSKGSEAYVQFVVLVNGESPAQGGARDTSRPLPEEATLPRIGLAMGLIGVSFTAGLFLPRLIAWLLRLWFYLTRK